MKSIKTKDTHRVFRISLALKTYTSFKFLRFLEKYDTTRFIVYEDTKANLYYIQVSFCDVQLTQEELKDEIARVRTKIADHHFYNTWKKCQKWLNEERGTETTADLKILNEKQYIPGTRRKKL